MTQTFSSSIVGILLAAGFSRRFGEQDKLLHPLASGESIAVTAGKALIAALPHAIAVVRAENLPLQTTLATLGYQVCTCETTAQEMADSLRQGILAAQTAFPDATGFVIALADMPFIQPHTIRQVAGQLQQSAIVQPVFHGKRGHPVGFSSCFASELLAIKGDQGAREILRAHPEAVMLLSCEDAGILRDIDTQADLLNQS